VITTLTDNVPFLYFPKHDIPLELETDASETALGAVLFQTIDGEKHYVSFHSRVLLSSEVCYSIPRKELLSIIVHVNYYRPYLLGAKFVLHIDAQALTYVFDKLLDPKTKNSTLLQWVSTLAEFDFEVHHIKGVENLLADLTSCVQSIEVLPSDISIGEVSKLIEQVHKLDHFGTNTIYNQIREQLDGDVPDNLMSAIVKFVKQCKVCQMVNTYRVRYSPPKQPDRLLPGEYIHMDLLQLPTSSKRFNYVLTMIDQFTGFTWLVPLRTKEMSEVYNAVVKIFCMFGFPERVKTDNGKEFINFDFHELCKNVAIKHNRTVAYNHHANGVVERQHRTIRATLHKIMLDVGNTSANNWDEFIPADAFSIVNLRSDEL
jgi:hypothetical protein